MQLGGPCGVFIFMPEVGRCIETGTKVAEVASFSKAGPLQHDQHSQLRDQTVMTARPVPGEASGGASAKQCPR